MAWPEREVSELSVDNWTKVSGYLTNNRTALKQAMVRISIPNTPKVRLGDAFLIDDLIITDVTDAKAALDAADANAQALSSLSASVTQNGKNITSQGSAITKLQSDVTQLGKDISGKADASALTNLTTRVTATEGSLKSQGDSLTNLQNSLNTTNSNVAKKADATALQSLQNTVEQHGRDLTTQSSALTNLENNFSSLAVGGTNLIRNADTLEGWSSRHATETYLATAWPTPGWRKVHPVISSWMNRRWMLPGVLNLYSASMRKVPITDRKWRVIFITRRTLPPRKLARGLKAGPVTARRSRN
ncbi:hypothetical protein [Klebsiella pneumoniae]|uniref:hypothetical protein n=1 Tax=Klebsiella pneumoniae TaxID=573 RepID=UPI00396F5DF5